MGNTAGSFSRRSPLAARPSKPSEEPVASLAAVGKLSVEPVYGLPFRPFRRLRRSYIMSRCVLLFVIAMLIITSAVYGQQQSPPSQQAIWDNLDKNKNGFIDRME